MVAHHIGGHGIAHQLEVAEAVFEVADIAWNAYQHRRGQHHDSPEEGTAAEDNKGGGKAEEKGEGEEDELVQMREENRRLRAILEENVTLLQGLSKSPAISKDCPPDLHFRLLAAMDSANFLNQLEALRQTSKVLADSFFPIKEVQDLKSLDIVVYDDHGEPSWWVWVAEDIDCDKVEELSGIDNENYVIINEDQVVDGIASFIAKCVVANPKSKKLSPEELRKTVTRALGGMKDRTMMQKVWHAGKLIYALSTWGIVLAGLCSHPHVVKAAVKGISASGKVVMKAF